MTEGLLRAAAWAWRWAATNEHAAGLGIEGVLERQAALLSRDDIRRLEAHYGAAALRAIARAYQVEADREVTDPEIELEARKTPRRRP